MPPTTRARSTTPSNDDRPRSLVGSPRVSSALIALPILLLLLLLGAGPGLRLGAGPAAAVDTGADATPVAPVRALPLGAVTDIPVRYAALAPDGVRFARVLVDAGDLLDPERALPPTRTELARAAATIVLTRRPDDTTLMTAAPSGVRVLDVTLDGDVAVIEVDGTLAAVRGTRVREEVLAQQLAQTLAEVAGVRAVRLRVEGRDVGLLWGNLDWSEGIVPLSSGELVAPSSSAPVASAGA
jgi:hypothetical protein